MLFSLRRDKIIELLNKKGQVKTQDLEKIFGVSAVTIRNDLEKLREDGYLERVHGGAVLPENEFAKPDYTFQTRSQKNVAAKIAICKSAAELIGEQRSFILDGSSTVLNLIPYFKQKNKINIITNGVYTALKTKDFENVNTILIGGMLRSDSGAIEGLLGEEILDKVNPDIMFTSAQGFTVEEGLLNFELYLVQLKKKIAQKSNKIVALLDHSKINNSSTASFAPPNKIDTIITDKKTPEEEIEKIKKAGIKVIVADE